MAPRFGDRRQGQCVQGNLSLSLSHTHTQPERIALAPLTRARRHPLAVAVALVVFASVLLAAPSAVGSQSSDGSSDRAVWPDAMRDCATDDALLVASDAAAQSDVYAAAILAGALGSRCIIDAGDRRGPLPNESLSSLQDVTGRLHVVGGLGAVSAAKIGQITEDFGVTDVLRFAGSSRWSTALLVGEYASTGRLSDGEEAEFVTEAAPSAADALWPSSMSKCSGAVPVVVAGDRAAQSDVYAAVTLAGAIKSRCLVDAGGRLGPMPFGAKASLAYSLHHGFIVGGHASVPLRKVAGYSLSRLSGADRWSTARLAGQVAAGTVAASPDGNAFARVSAGPDSNACALHVDGSVACWQGNSRWLSDGRVDLGVTMFPVRYPKAIDVATGSLHACALGRMGSPSCWNIYTNELLPQLQSSSVGTAFVAIAIAYDENNDESLCGLTVAGVGKCLPMGAGEERQYKHSRNDNQFVSAKFYASNMCGLDANGRVSCAGPLAEAAETLHDLQAHSISVGAGHVCGIDNENGTVDCVSLNTDQNFDYFETFGEFPTTAEHYPPGRHHAITSARDYVCALSYRLRANCWGASWYGEGSPPEGAFLDISAARDSACGIRRDGVAICWGLNYTSVTSSRYGGAVVSLGNRSFGVEVVAATANRGST